MKGIRAVTLAAAGALTMTFAGVSSAAGPVPGKPGAANIVEVAAAVNAQTGEFSYLLGAATCDFFEGAIVALLSGEDKLTLFAPTDDAFKNLQRALGVAEEDLAPGVTCSLGPDVVFDVLAYHVTDGRRFSNSVFNANNSKMIEMLNGQYIVTNPNLTISDNAGQTIGLPSLELVNINASNGVIHVIDTVLLPFAP